VTRPEDQDAARLAAESLAAGDATGWFERLYAQAERGTAVVPWDREAPSALLADWAADQDPSAGAGRSAIVVGCGFGRDAEFVASLGFQTHAFDISPTAIETARVRHPGSTVDYAVADLLALPAYWSAGFDLVVESHNVQALPPELHASAAAAVASLVAPGGTLLVLAAAADGPPQAPPWPLNGDELDLFATGGLRRVSAELLDSNGPRWRAVFTR
jgi:SAM-dependent methyltransferase